MQTSNSSLTCSLVNCRSDIVRCFMPHDDDLLIDQKAVESDITTKLFIGDDTELLILLYHTNLRSMTSSSKKSTKESHLGNINVLKQQVGSSVCTHILFMHEILGCETNPTLMTLIQGPHSCHSKQLMTSLIKLQCLTHRQ